MRSYEAARKLFGLLEIFATIVIVVGGLVVLAGLFAAPTNTAMMLTAGPGIAVALFGFIGLAFTQSSRAAVDTAELTQQVLKVSRDQHDINKQLLQLAQQSKPSGYAEASKPLQNVSFDTERVPPAATAIEPPAPAVERIEYSGATIEKVEGKYRIGDDLFATIEAAKQAVDRPEARAYLAIGRSAS